MRPLVEVALEESLLPDIDEATRSCSKSPQQDWTSDQPPETPPRVDPVFVEVQCRMRGRSTRPCHKIAAYDPGMRAAIRNAIDAISSGPTTQVHLFRPKVITLEIR